jgi:tubulin-specific chaperone A
MDLNEKKQLKIKAGSLRRLGKELELYEKEQEKEQARVARLKNEGADVHDVKHAVHDQSKLYSL